MIKSNQIRFIMTMTIILCAMFAGAGRADFRVELESGSVAFGSLTKEDLYAGFVEAGASDGVYALRALITDDENAGWTLSVRADTAEFTSVFAQKSCEDLLWRVDGPEPYIALTQYDEPAASGAGSDYVDIDLKLLAGWGDRADSYGIVLVFTLTSD
ncbi:MAG: hypothetical protein BWY28_01152 [bacterium ADurb.Bin236]|nr:MAG: hypothetical protein BWY28_01152 [bacterium ADurb.Bin236]HPN93270.1 hypothetical protein [bacterium]